MNTPGPDATTLGFVAEMFLCGTLTDDHDTEYDGGHYITPSLIDHDDGKENDGEEAQRATVRTPRT